MIHTADKGTSRGKKAKKVVNILLKVIAGIVIAILLFIAIVFAVNKISAASEQKRLEPYGQQVAVDGKKMNVFIGGQGEETIVLLPGFGTASPVLDFKPLIDELTPHYKVVVVEPFGYGLSDQADKERTTANIVSEIHEALQSLKINNYTLMGHSISGIYSLAYVNQYPNEVKAFVGLDSSVPALKEEQKIDSSVTTPIKWFRDLGFHRIQLKLSDDQYEGLPYDEATKQQINILIRKNMYNNTQLNEAEHMNANFTAAETLVFPNHLPLLFFVQANNPATDRWIPEHEKQVKQSNHGEMVLLEAGHYVHRTHFKEIAEKVRAFISDATTSGTNSKDANNNHADTNQTNNLESSLLTESEQQVYDELLQKLDKQKLIGLEPLSVAKLYVQASFDQQHDLQYFLYTTREGHVQWTKEEHEQDLQKQDKSSLANELENSKRLFKNIEKGSFVSTSDYEGYIKYEKDGDKDAGFQMVQDEDGIWKVAFMPIQ
ncbi:alpha/beta hydrolase [Paenibacillus turicensis]